MFTKKLVRKSNKVSLTFFLLTFLIGTVFYLALGAKTAKGWDCDETEGDDVCLCPFSWGSCGTNICPGDCGVPEPGTYASKGGQCGNPYGNEGNWCHRWQWCCKICSPGDCTGATPTPLPGTPNPTNPPQPTTPPGSPVCSVSGPTNLAFGGGAGSYTFRGDDGDSNLNSVEGWWSPESVENWTNIFDHNFSNRASYTTTQSWACPGVGDYYVVCNAYDSSGRQCSGNPFQLPPGWDGCGVNSALMVNCSSSPPSQPTLTATWSCAGVPAPVTTLSWTASTGANDYELYRCTGASCIPTTLITTTTLLTYQDNTVVSGSTYGYRVRGHRTSDGAYSSYSNTVYVSPVCPTCDINLNGLPSIPMLSTQTYTVSNNTPPVGTITQVNFTSSNSAVVSICNSTTVPCPSGQGSYNDSTATYNMNATAYTINASSLLRAGVVMSGLERCSSNLSVGTVNPSGWWQNKEGDLVTNGDITSIIPGGCVVDASCDESLITFDTGDFPGLPQAGGRINVGPNGGFVSQGFDWNAEGVAYGGPTLSYNYFRNKLPASVVPATVPNNPVTQADLTSGGTEYPTGSGNFFYQYTGALTIGNGGTIDFGVRRVVVFVQGSVTINSKILTQNGTGVFVLISSGNISVNPSVGGPQEFPTCKNSVCTPDLEGVYFTQGQFSTGNAGVGADNQLHVRGSVAAWNSIVLERDLPNNTLTPAELFEYGIDQVMAMPSALKERNVLWKEIAP